MTRPWLDASNAVLQAVIGDYLAERDSGLATRMALYHRGRRVQALPGASSRLCVLVHGMADTEACWAFPEERDLDYGRLLEREHGLTPLYVRYNTGLPISDNGRALAALLAEVVATAPQPVEQLTLIGHSLGGLVIRSACHHGREADWLTRVRRAFYLGSPHRGSPLEQAGRVAEELMQASGDPVVQLLGDLAEIRSAAVKSMRDGALLESGQPVLLDERIEHNLAAGSLPGALAVLGDGLVGLASATGAPGEGARHVRHFPGLSHRALAQHREVYAWISSRCGPLGEAAGAEPELAAEPALPLHAWFELLQDGVERGSAAIQKAHEALAARPYGVLAAVPSLRTASQALHALHLGLLRGTYASVRLANELVRAAAQAAAGAPQDPDAR